MKTEKKKSNSNNEFKKRKITSILILLFIVPFFVIAGLPFNNNLIAMVVIHSIFEFTLLLLFMYGIYESTTFLFSRKQNNF